MQRSKHHTLCHSSLSNTLSRLQIQRAWHLCQALFISCIALLNMACSSSLSPEQRGALLDSILVDSEAKIVDTKYFSHQVAFFRRNETNNKLIVYIEGDGYAWKSRTTVSTNPTPLRPVAAIMANRDNRNNILYIARPCQYVIDKRCHKNIWTNRRYSNEVIASIYNVIQGYITKKTDGIEVLGYSGGGLIAMMLSGSYDLPVEKIVTIAANIDHLEWTHYHRVSPLLGSRNISEVADKLQKIKQVHFVGGEDDNVPFKLLRKSIEKNGLNEISMIINKRRFDHHCCWAEQWPELLQTINK